MVFLIYHYFSCIIISHASLFLVRHYFSHAIISYMLLFITYHPVYSQKYIYQCIFLQYLLYIMISYIALFLIHHYFLYVIISHGHYFSRAIISYMYINAKHQYTYFDYTRSFAVFLALTLAVFFSTLSSASYWMHSNTLRYFQHVIQCILLDALSGNMHYIAQQCNAYSLNNLRYFQHHYLSHVILCIVKNIYTETLAVFLAYRYFQQINIFHT